ncbi:uncharacterized protein HMPREF1541_08951 [Cyphellophora europaea CBS 101466]|uniref:NmrA-like domain-containing protein n=1 Tax=Cyphellophora europaea (strain CBS 101466) TaxID=1220924 RepID=W2RLT6_CYPE1|nr:uncharacterized protein HMPREF1541_08951 [Cyphellophora europaea CBS 101466]ETN36673.1 hypothetical protein HMPREF1541_08951 [Cyphellophora europaea CBS 101466]
MTTSTPPKPILILGAGELGGAIISALLSHPAYDPTTTPLTLVLRPSTLASPPPTRASELAHYRAHSISLLGADIDATSGSDLSSLFAPFDTVIHAGGMLAPRGTQAKVTDAVLAARVRRYIPWQHGVDYDVIGPEAGKGLFAEQCGVRRRLRAQRDTAWVIVSCGIFMSFLFEGAWGVVVPLEGGQGKDEEVKVKVTALGSWEDGITATTAEDIGKTCARLLLDDGEEKEWGKPVFIAGETLTYSQLADVVGQVTGKEVVKELWDRERFARELEANPEDKLWKYRAVFGGGRGVSWPASETWSQQRGMNMQGVGEWLKGRA